MVRVWDVAVGAWRGGGRGGGRGGRGGGGVVSGGRGDALRDDVERPCAGQGWD